jgi:hypothetical protein
VKKLAALCILVSLLGSKAFAFDIPVEVIESGEDRLGRRLVYLLKEGINKSSSMHITYNKDELRITVRILTVANGAPKSATAYGASFLISRPKELAIYDSSTVGYCGADRLQECADSLVVDAYNLAEEVHKYRWLYEKD